MAARWTVWLQSIIEKPLITEVEVVQKSRFILLHYSMSKVLWDWLILIATFYVAVIVPYNISFTIYDETAVETHSTVATDVVVEFLFIIDIILSFRTTYINQSGKVVYDSRSISKHYATTWFLVDLAASLPIDLLYAAHIPMTSFTHLLKTVRLLRLLRLLQKVDRYSKYSAMVLTLLMSMFALLAHWMACIWYTIGHKEMEDSKTWHIGWLSELGKRMETPYTNSTVGGPTAYNAYITALYFALSSLTTVGFGNVSANTDAEMIFSICTMLVSVLMYALVFGNISAIIQRTYSRHSLYHTRMKELKDFMRIHHLPHQLKQRIMEYFETTWSVNNGIDVNKLLHDFPFELRADIAMQRNQDIIQLQVFRGASRGCLRSISLHIKNSFCVPGEYLICQDDVLRAIYYVCSGSLEVLKDTMVLERLEAGNLIGSDLPETDQVIKTNADVKALTYCHIQYISVRDLKDVLVLYPEYASVFASHIQDNLTYNLREDSQDEKPRLPSIVETQGDESDNSVHLPPATRSHCNHLLTSCSSLVGLHRQSSTPQSPSKKENSTAQGESAAEQKPSQRLIPTVTCFGPPDLGPRVVERTEDHGHMFHFNMERTGPRASTGGSTHESTQANVTLLLEPEEVGQIISQLNNKIENLNQDLYELTRGRYHQMHLLHTHASVHHYRDSHDSYPNGVQASHSPPTQSTIL
ncbi:potassium voltage-gated channel subfamily H member 8-like [Micropterus salmoides]|uniref:potassium voltage-gated channel subfamily H member 8-like n=1 Tax=Micropterus salmoides TaxID=27706 RepID=UPI0018ED736D|nr:potassium voltage-gated channel subfamily H member 8-like [Micropterus salmoides]